MAFKLPEDPKGTVVEINSGTARTPRKEVLKNDVGISVQLDLNNHEVSGKIFLHSVKTKLKSKAELAQAIENFVNRELEAEL